MVPHNPDAISNTALHYIGDQAICTRSPVLVDSSRYFGHAYNLLINDTVDAIELSTYEYNVTRVAAGAVIDRESAIYTHSVLQANDTSRSTSMVLGYSATFCDPFVDALVNSGSVVSFANNTQAYRYTLETQNATIAYILSQYRDLIAENATFVCNSELFSKRSEHIHNSHVYMNVVHNCEQLCVNVRIDNTNFFSTRRNMRTYAGHDGIQCIYDIEHYTPTTTETAQKTAVVTDTHDIENVDTATPRTLNTTLYSHALQDIVNATYVSYTINVTSVPVITTDINANNTDIYQVRHVPTNATRTPAVSSAHPAITKNEQDDFRAISLLFIPVIFGCLIFTYMVYRDGIVGRYLHRCTAALRNSMLRCRQSFTRVPHNDTVDVEDVDRDKYNAARIARITAMAKTMRGARQARKAEDDARATECVSLKSVRTEDAT